MSNGGTCARNYGFSRENEFMFNDQKGSRRSKMNQPTALNISTYATSHETLSYVGMLVASRGHANVSCLKRYTVRH